MDLVVKLMFKLKPTTPIITWLPRSRSKSYPNDSAISTATSFDDVTDALVVTMKHFTWKKVGKTGLKVDLLDLYRYPALYLF